MNPDQAAVTFAEAARWVCGALLVVFMFGWFVTWIEREYPGRGN